MVEGLLALVVTAAISAATVTANGIDLVDKDNARGLPLGLLKHIAHPRRAHTDKHLDKVGARNGEKWHFGLARDRLSQQRFTGSRWADHQDTLGDSPTQTLKLGWVAKKFYQFADIFFGLVNPGDVGKGGVDLIAGQQFGFTLAKAHWPALPATAALHLAHKKHENAQNQQDWEGRHQQLRY